MILIAVEINSTFSSAQNVKRLLSTRSEVPKRQALTVIGIKQAACIRVFVPLLYGCVCVTNVVFRIAPVLIVVFKVVSQMEQFVVSKIVNVCITTIGPN